MHFSSSLSKTLPLKNEKKLFHNLNGSRPFQIGLFGVLFKLKQCWLVKSICKLFEKLFYQILKDFERVKIFFLRSSQDAWNWIKFGQGDNLVGKSEHLWQILEVSDKLSQRAIVSYWCKRGKLFKVPFKMTFTLKAFKKYCISPFKCYTWSVSRVQSFFPMICQ